MLKRRLRKKLNKQLKKASHKVLKLAIRREKVLQLMEQVNHQTQELNQLSRKKDGSQNRTFRISFIISSEKKPCREIKSRSWSCLSYS